MRHYAKQERVLPAVDSIIFGFDGIGLRLLLIQRGFEPMKGKWLLMGGFIGKQESAEDAVTRVVKELTGIGNVYLEQLQVFSEPKRDPVTMPQLYNLYTSIMSVEMDKTNFSRKVLGMGLLLQTKEKDLSGSKRGVFYYRLDIKKAKEKFRF
jgi:ADP-ribose pyrophosphatase YjhB (NUDIX family)